jgi:hypothetical protein
MTRFWRPLGGALIDTTRVREGIRKGEVFDILDRWDAGEVTQEKAGGAVGMSVHSFQRWKDRCEAGDDGGGGADARPYRDKYADFAVQLLHEQIQERYNHKLGYTVTKLHPHRARLVRPALKRSAHRKKRPRRPMDAASGRIAHMWIEGQAIDGPDRHHRRRHERDLLDDPRRRGGNDLDLRDAAREIIAEHGLLCALYTDQPLLPHPREGWESLEHVLN